MKTHLPPLDLTQNFVVPINQLVGLGIDIETSAVIFPYADEANETQFFHLGGRQKAVEFVHSHMVIKLGVPKLKWKIELLSAGIYASPGDDFNPGQFLAVSGGRCGVVTHNMSRGAWIFDVNTCEHLTVEGIYTSVFDSWKLLGFLSDEIGQKPFVVIENT